MAGMFGLCGSVPRTLRSGAMVETTAGSVPTIALDVVFSARSLDRRAAYLIPQPHMCWVEVRALVPDNCHLV